MNYLVIGEPCVDVIHKINNEILHSYGGILYSLITMSVLAGKDDKVIPVMNLGEDEYENITGILKNYPNVDISGIQKCSHPTRKVNLYYNLYNTDKKARLEQSTEPTYEITFDWIKNFLPQADAILINMISGVDVSLDTLKKVREEFKKYIHIDIHNIVMAMDEEGHRFHKSIPDWKEWTANSDTVQMNEFEAATLTEDKKKEYEIAEQILLNSANEIKGLIITRGKFGVSGFTKKEKNFGGEKFLDIDKHDLNSIENPHFKDSTGCGDVFAASFTIDYSQSGDFEKALHFANRKASYKSSLEGIDELIKLK
ncbi:MAG: carbohydrate kinase family protein [Bacteroidetes bacterium]|mgnify:CR=1 FL=1|nr:carbohydrate kinase family protein [Bacteroidota bacterium]MBX7044609.1 carbohydrate kinase family protein [Ignavibacteria bacterium]